MAGILSAAAAPGRMLVRCERRARTLRRSDVLVLRLGFIPLADSEHLRAEVDAFAAALSTAMGDTVRPLFAPNYQSLLTSLEQNIAQIAWVPPVIAARAVRSGVVLPAAVALRGGASSYATALFSRSGAPFSNAQDLERVRAGWVDKQSAGGYLVIRAALVEAGVDVERAFADESFLGTHEAVARAVLDRKIDVGATYVTYHPGTKSVARAGWREVGGDDEFRVVTQAGPIPADFFGVHKSLAGARVELLQRALVDGSPVAARAAAMTLFQTDGFVRPTDEHKAALEGLLANVDSVRSRSPSRQA
jgi:phosphonate transport system substrate-binding protein